MQLFIGNQNYSTWSLRAWLIFAQHQLDVEVVKLPLFSHEFYQTLATVTPTAKVPALIDGDLHVWESLAILEYINEAYLAGKAWPDALLLRAKARALAAEMHSGFTHLRSQMPMNIRGRRRIQLSEMAQKEVDRIDALWSEQMAQFPGQWLFGRWSIADAMYAPVALRFQTYGITLSEPAQAYLQQQLSSAPMQQWIAQASEETEIVSEDEAGEPV